MPKRKKIAILGKLNTKLKAPFDDKSWEIWSMNLHKDEPLLLRVDKWFDIHIKPEKLDADVLRYQFPFEECEKLVGGKYFKCTPAYLIAYAILQKATDIALYGMKFQADHERRRGELQNVQNMIWFAKGRGINVIAPYDKLELMPEHIPEINKDFDQ